MRKNVEDMDLDIQKLCELRDKLNEFVRLHGKAKAKRFVKALFDYEASDEGQLSIKAGTVLELLDDSNPDWWEGELNGRTGYFPKDYVELVQPNLPQTAHPSNISFFIYAFPLFTLKSF